MFTPTAQNLIDPKDPIELFKFIPPDSQKYIFEFFKRSRKGCLIGKQLYKLESPNDDI